MLSLAVWSIVHWAVLPGIMGYIFLYNVNIIAQQTDQHLRTSAIAGFWAGLVLLLVFVFYNLGSISPPTLPMGPIPVPSILSVGGCAVVGFAGFLAVRWLIPTRFVGLLSCVLTATSTIALYSYLFIAAYKVFIIVAVLGVTLGALLNIVLFPRILAAAGSAKHQASG